MYCLLEYVTCADQQLNDIIFHGFSNEKETCINKARILNEGDWSNYDSDTIRFFPIDDDYLEYDGPLLQYDETNSKVSKYGGGIVTNINNCGGINRYDEDYDFNNEDDDYNTEIQYHDYEDVEDDGNTFVDPDKMYRARKNEITIRHFVEIYDCEHKKKTMDHLREHFIMDEVIATRPNNKTKYKSINDDKINEIIDFLLGNGYGSNNRCDEPLSTNARSWKIYAIIEPIKLLS
jgi:hypothetical protein